MASAETDVDEAWSGDSLQDESSIMKASPELEPPITTTSTANPPTMSPRTTRRLMLQTELDSSLRQNLLWERQQKNAANNAVAKRQKTAVSPQIQDTDTSIELWQADTDTQEKHVIGVGPVGSLYSSIVELLRLILTSMRTQASVSRHYQPLESISAALFFWGTDLNVSQGELDEALRDSPQLRDTCLLVLVSIGELITSSIVRLFSGKDNEKESSSLAAITNALEQARNILGQQYYPAHHPKQDEEAILHALRAKINNIINLGPSLASPAEENFDAQEPRMVEDVDQHLPQQTFINSVAQRFPQAASAMVTHLGQLNWKRYDHMLHLQRTDTQLEVETAVIERAKTMFNDSALGSSAAAQSEFGLVAKPEPSSYSQSKYAPTVVSSRASASHKRLPSLPPQARSGMPFTCVICNRQVRYRRTKDWKKHIFDDLLAYACPFPECSIADAFFQDSDAMMDHLEKGHALDVSLSEVACPLCLEYSSSDRDALLLHLSRHMEEIALAILPSAVDSDVDSGSDSEKSGNRSDTELGNISSVYNESEAETGDLRPHALHRKDFVAGQDQQSWTKNLPTVDDDSREASSNLFVTGIHPSLTEEEVSLLFEKYGQVEGCTIIRDPHSKESRGFGFVNMVTSDQADTAREGLQGEVFYDRTLSIEKALPPHPLEQPSDPPFAPIGISDLDEESSPANKVPGLPNADFSPWVLGKYVFSWEHAADEVFVTGTFDDWQKTVKLEKVDGVFKKTVELPKVYTQYKFVVDGNWTINESAPKEADGYGIISNVVQPGDIVYEPISTRYDISSPSYQDITKPTTSGEALDAATQNAEANKLLDQRRKSRKDYVDDIWARPHQPPNISSPDSKKVTHLTDDPDQHTRDKRASNRALSSPARKMPARKTDQFGATLLAKESEKGDLAAVQEAYEQAPDELDCSDFAGISPLQKASLHGWTEIVRFLLSKGCNTTCEGNDGDTPLIDAVENGHLDVVDLLLNVARVNPHHTNRKGQRAIDVLDHEDDHADEIEKLLREAMKNIRDVKKNDHVERSQSRPQSRLLYNEYNVETLIEKAGSGDIHAVSDLLNSNIRPNLASGIAAARGGHYDILTMLLASGLKPDVDPRKHPETPMKAAIAGGHLRIVQLLLEQDGFDPTRFDKGGVPYYMFANENKAGDNWQEIRDLLMEAFDKHISSLSSAASQSSQLRGRFVTEYPKPGQEGVRRKYIPGRPSMSTDTAAAQYLPTSREASVSPLDAMTDTNDGTKDTWQCTFCLQYLAPKSWRRHEEAQHHSKYQWTCLATGPRITITDSSGETSVCAFCLMKDPSEEHLLNSHRISDCTKKSEADRSFGRPDHLRQHFKNFHKSSLPDILKERWRSNRDHKEEREGWVCGFCSMKLFTWDQRAVHIANHFKDGMTMASWRIG